ncbi:MAG: hypothetical protein LBQ32_08530 [Burkholderiaceae bacterium]|jgi:hypothetical protein|nr:hypothetical protein [Burkholderiaceae bacterium]
MPRLNPKVFLHLDEFLGAWFHQDFDLMGDTLEEILEAYRGVSTDEERAAVVHDIDRFLALPEDNLDDVFDSTFDPGGVYLPGWGMSAREWLQRVRELL